jgi:voltage-gated potassium channel
MVKAGAAKRTMAQKDGLEVMKRSKTIGRFDFAEKWQLMTSVPFALLGLIYLAVYSMQVVYAKTTDLVAALEVASILIWIIFLLDAAIRLAGARDPLRFVRQNWLELIALAIPFLRVLRVFRVVVAIRGLKHFLKSRIEATGLYMVMLIPLTWFAGAVAVLDAESSNSEASINNLPDALWWSLTTITTVGYGEFYPTTAEGKFVAAILMVMGIALFSAGAGMFASWIMRSKPEAENQ